MKKNISVAVLGSTGYTGLELINILSKHPKISINFLGSNSNSGSSIKKFDNRINAKKLPKLDNIKNLVFSKFDVVFLCLPNQISQEIVRKNFNLTNFIDLSADFRINDPIIYKKNYGIKHSCPDLLKKFIYGLAEINYNKISKSTNIAVPGCYPTSILLPLIPLMKKKLIKTKNIIIDSKSGYSGAGKDFNLKNLFNNDTYNFYNYKTNDHRHICEIHQELKKFNKSSIKFSFNPHILPIFRGLMSTIYCDLSKNVSIKDINDCLDNFYSNSKFIKIIKNEQRMDFFKVQHNNNCFIKLHNHYDSSKIIITSLIDNLLKGASGQAVQCMNIMFGYNENLGIN